MNDEKKWIKVTRFENIPLREGRSITVDDREIAIFRLGDKLFAIDNRCPHKGGPLAEGIVSGSKVVCPLHAWKIDLESGIVAGQSGEQSCVKTYPIRVQDGIIELELSAQERANMRNERDCFANSLTNVVLGSSVVEARI